MNGNIVARRYAHALFSLGQAKGGEVVKTYGDNLSALAEVLDGAPELVKIFRNPVFTASDKKAIVKKILDKVKVDKMVANFCFLLAEKGRLAVLPDIAFVYAKLLDVAQGIVRGEIITAISLNDALQKQVKDQLEKQSGSQVVLEYSVDPAILGGLKLKVGDKVLDASIKAQLEILRETIKRGE
ncbi:MAG: F0F1 ATP synthase subunit delta [Deltaproteobacteria bacterium]|nr:F0F1 ATP synthase subunit delta [Deltaproteobacteria bacterium]